MTGVEAWFGNAYKEHSPQYVNLVDSGTSKKNFEEDVQTLGYGLAAIKSQGKSVEYDSDEQGYISRYRHITYGKGYIVTMEELQDDLYMEVSKRRASQVAFSMNQTKENVVANMYNRAFNSDYTGGDGVSLLSNAHPTPSGDQSNILATAAALSQTALEDLVIQIGKATDAKGLKINLTPQSLIVPVDLRFDAQRILKSSLEPATNNNAINTMNGFFPKGVSVNNYLTSTTAWFIRTDCPNGLKILNRMPLRFTRDNDFDTENAKAKALERYSVGWTDFLGLYGTAGA